MLGALLSYVSLQWLAHQARFAAAGLIATGVNWVAVWALMGLGGLAAVTLGFLLGSGINFALQRWWTYRVHARAGAPARQLLAYLGMSGLLLCLNNGLFYLLFDAAHLGYLLSQIVLTALLGLAGYWLTKYIFLGGVL